MKIHKEGLRIIWGITGFLILLNAAILLLFKDAEWLQLILPILSVLFLVFILRFFRKPARALEENNRYVYAPADGEIVVIEQTVEPEYLKDERIQISIFMSVWNVHINWYPIKGIVNYFKHHNGHFFVARHPKSSTENERTSVVVTDEKGRSLMIRQIAGAVARRIVCYSKDDKAAEQGKQMGFIKFGSRVDVFVPLDAKINVKPGQHAVGSETVLAYFD